MSRLSTERLGTTWLGTEGDAEAGGIETGQWGLGGSRIPSVVEEKRNWQELTLTWRVTKQTRDDILLGLDENAGDYDILDASDGTYSAVDRANGENTYQLGPPQGRGDLRYVREYVVDKYEEEVIDQAGDRYEVTVKFVAKENKTPQDTYPSDLYPEYALDLNGPDGDTVEAPVDVSGRDLITVMGWVDWETVSSDSSNLGNAAMESINPRFDFSIHANDTNIITYWHVGDPTDAASARVAVDPTAGPYHIAVRRNSTNEVEIIVGAGDTGRDTGTGVGLPSTLDATAVRFGKPASVSGDPFDGQSDDWVVADGALSDAEIRAHMEDGTLPASTISAYRFNDGPGASSITDTESGNDGTIKGSPEWVEPLAPGYPDSWKFEFSEGDVVTTRVKQSLLREGKDGVDRAKIRFGAERSQAIVVEESLRALGAVSVREIPDRDNLPKDYSDDDLNTVTVTSPDASDGTFRDGDYVADNWETTWTNDEFFEVRLSLLRLQ